MLHQCVDARFYFWDGKTAYTVEFCYSLYTWYIFDGRNQTDSLFKKRISVISKSKSPNRDLAEDILNEYLESKQ